jgi:O-antigen ligase
LVSLGACLFTLALSRFNRKRTAAILIISVTGVAVLLATQYELIYEGILRRFSMVSTGQDQATELRLIAINGAWDQFLTSPLMGDGIEERNTGFYPHNVILEALMTTGLIGAIPFVLLLIKATHASWTIMRKHEEFIWLALIQVQYLIAAQLSGAIYQATSLWVSVAAVLAVSSKGFFLTSDQTSKRKRRPIVTSPARPAFAGPVR